MFSFIKSNTLKTKFFILLMKKLIISLVLFAVILLIGYISQHIYLSKNDIDDISFNNCENSGGTWRLFSNTCADYCWFGKKSKCGTTMTYSCDCGINMCWDGVFCDIPSPAHLVDNIILNNCENSGGTWRFFSNNCVDSCDVRGHTTCGAAISYSCDCGIDKCWNGKFCIFNNESSENKKVWIEINPIQCLGNPWEIDWIESHNNNYSGYPRDPRTPELEQEEVEIIKNYYKKQGIILLDIKSKQTYEDVCAACSCPQGYTLYLLIFEYDLNKMIDLGYKNSNDSFLLNQTL
jgi:hypothetical protein